MNNSASKRESNIREVKRTNQKTNQNVRSQRPVVQHSRESILKYCRPIIPQDNTINQSQRDPVVLESISCMEQYVEDTEPDQTMAVSSITHLFDKDMDQTIIQINHTVGRGVDEGYNEFNQGIEQKQIYYST
jgi:hypothetical protein